MISSRNKKGSLFASSALLVMPSAVLPCISKGTNCDPVCLIFLTSGCRWQMMANDGKWWQSNVQQTFETWCKITPFEMPTATQAQQKKHSLTRQLTYIDTYWHTSCHIHCTSHWLVDCQIDCQNVWHQYSVKITNLHPLTYNYFVGKNVIYILTARILPHVALTNSCTVMCSEIYQWYISAMSNILE